LKDVGWLEGRILSPPLSPPLGPLRSVTGGRSRRKGRATEDTCQAEAGPKKTEGPRCESRAFKKNPGSVLLSHRVAPAVPSALESLTSVFGMGTGVASPELPPGKTGGSAHAEPDPVRSRA
jgi:hypothetical protein